MVKKPKMTILVGLPRSGKSTYAKKIQKYANAYGGNTVIVSSDEIRLLEYGQRYLAGGERYLWKTHGIVLKVLMQQQFDVIVDSTNINKVHRATLIELAKEFGYRTHAVCFTTDVAECVERALKDGMEDLVPVIEQMASDIEYPDNEEVNAVTPYFGEVEIKMTAPFEGIYTVLGFDSDRLESEVANVMRVDRIPVVKSGPSCSLYSRLQREKKCQHVTPEYKSTLFFLERPDTPTEDRDWRMGCTECKKMGTRAEMESDRTPTTSLAMRVAERTIVFNAPIELTNWLGETRTEPRTENDNVKG